MMPLLMLIFSCSVAPYLNYKASDSIYQRFSFDAFKMEGSDVVFLHCEVLVCAKNSMNTTRCSEGCIQDSSRRRRETNKDQRKGVTSLGPLKILLDRLLVQGQNDGKSNF